jgi:hypothetical protein
MADDLKLNIPDFDSVLLNERDRPIIRGGYFNDIRAVSRSALSVRTMNDLRECATRLRKIADRMDYTATVHEGFAK